jgi:cell fate regulator YaaT (PSP1 superfamily)
MQRVVDPPLFLADGCVARTKHRMPIHPLPVLSEEAEQKAIDQLKPPESIVVRYGYMRSIGEFRYTGSDIPGCGTKLVVRTPRGVELAEMLTTSCGNGGCGHSVTRKQMLDYIDASGGKQYPFTSDGKVLRVATPDDLMEQSRLDANRGPMIEAAKEQIKQLKLDMKVVETEVLLGGERVIFYFTSEGRIDFRELVRNLASELHTRIEMRQVGSRDEARLVADYEKCGQHCCCKQFLKVLKPVSMKNAKIQKATLDPAKISGRCGRLMCCLRYEEVTYDELRKRLPHRNTRVMTDEGLGTVVNTQILTQLVLVDLDSSPQRSAFPVENIRKVTRDEEAEIRQQQEAEAEAQREEAQKRIAEQKTDRNRRRRRRRRGGGSGGGEGGLEPRRPQPGKPLADGEVQNKEGGNAASAGEGGSADGDAPKKKRRRRRRRRRRGGGGDGSSPDQGKPDGGGD